MKSVVVLAEALDDLEKGRDFYNFQQTGVGDDFVESLLSDLQQLEYLHGIHPLHHGFFRMLAERFPYGIYYEVSEASVKIYAVLDLRRDPLWIRDELSFR